VMAPTFPVLARLALAEPGFVPALRVEAGLSPPCCKEGDACGKGYGSCAMSPDPRYKGGWTMAPMAWDAGCEIPEGSGLAACTGDDAQFTAPLLPPEGKARYRYAVRYSFDYGQSWDWCDLAPDAGRAGNADGFSLQDAGDLWVE